MTTLHGEEIKVGDKVWDVRFGWSEVVFLHKGSSFPIQTNFSSYLESGKGYEEHKSPSLFWQEFEIPANAYEKPKEKVKKYVVVYQKDDGVFETSGGFFESLEEFDLEYGRFNWKGIYLIPESMKEFDE